MARDDGRTHDFGLRSGRDSVMAKEVPTFAHARPAVDPVATTTLVSVLPRFWHRRCSPQRCVNSGLSGLAAPHPDQRAKAAPALCLRSIGRTAARDAGNHRDPINLVATTKVRDGQMRMANNNPSVTSSAEATRWVNVIDAGQSSVAKCGCINSIPTGMRRHRKGRTNVRCESVEERRLVPRSEPCADEPST